jgi:Ca2+:H+ antiporter
VKDFFKNEYKLLIATAVVAIYMLFDSTLLYPLENTISTIINFLVIFTIMLLCSFSVIKHADALAQKLGEPYGTLILTLSVISIEVVAISAVMITGSDNPSLARDMMFAVLMIVLNGLVGFSLLIGGWKHKQQNFNLQGVNTYLSLIAALSVLTLVMPAFTRSTEVGTFSTTQTIFAIVVTLGIYLIFLGIQSIRHKDFFTLGLESDSHHYVQTKSLGYHTILLLLYMVPIVLLSKKLAIVVDYGAVHLGLPIALGGMLVAILVLSPEGLASIQAAKNNNLQRSVNICFGSAAATISLTVPAVLLISLFTGEAIVLGLEAPEMVLLLLTLFVSHVNFSSGKTNIMHGALHLLLFMLYLVLIFD